jgi:hypothetical protein
VTPEEKAVIKAAQRWVRVAGSAPSYNAVQRSIEVGYALRDAVAALKVSREPLHTVAAIPCGALSSTGAMLCELPAGHDPDDTLRWTNFAVRGEGAHKQHAQYAYRPHEGRAANGSARRWRTWVERWKP